MKIIAFVDSGMTAVIDNLDLFWGLPLDILNDYTLLQNKGGRWFKAPPPPHRSFENRWRNIGILYIILKGIVWRFRFILNFSKIFWFREFMSKFSRNDSQWLSSKCLKKFKLLKYEHIIYSFEARTLEILNM